MEKEITLSQFLGFINERVPFSWSEEWDNSGLQIGDPSQILTGILLAFNPVSEAIAYAVKSNNNLIITHHPLLFKAVKSISTQTYAGKIIYDAIKGGIAIISLHTNLDKAPFGISVKIVEKLGWNIEGPIVNDGEWGLGVYGEFPKTKSVCDVAREIKDSLKVPIVRFPEVRKNVKRFAFCGGSCFSIIDDVKKLNIDLFITSDVKYHDFLDTLHEGLPVISIDHSVEKVGFYAFKELLENWLGKKNWNLSVENFYEKEEISCL